MSFVSPSLRWGPPRATQRRRRGTRRARGVGVAGRPTHRGVAGSRAVLPRLRERYQPGGSGRSDQEGARPEGPRQCGSEVQQGEQWLAQRIFFTADRAAVRWWSCRGGRRAWSRGRGAGRRGPPGRRESSPDTPTRTAEAHLTAPKGGPGPLARALNEAEEPPRPRPGTVRCRRTTVPAVSRPSVTVCHLLMSTVPVLSGRESRLVEGRDLRGGRPTLR